MKQFDDPKKAIKKAVSAGDLVLVKKIVESGEVDISPYNYYFEKGNNKPIQLAIERGFYDIAQYLLDKGSNPEVLLWNKELEDELRMLELLAYKQDLRMLELLISYGANVARNLSESGMRYRSIKKSCKAYLTSTQITTAERVELENKIKKADEHHTKVFKVLLDYAIGCGFTMSVDNLQFPFFKNVDVSGFNFIGISIDGVPITKEKLIKLGALQVDQALFTLADLKAIEDVTRRNVLKERITKAMTSMGGIARADGTLDLVPLSGLIGCGNTEGVRARLPFVNPNSTDHPDSSPIAQAAKAGHFDIVKLLASHPSISQSGINKAIESCCDEEIAAYLSEFIEFDSNGNSKLHLAAWDADVVKVRQLIAQNADVNQLNKEGQTPLNKLLRKTTCNAEDKLETIKILLENNARVSKTHIDDAAQLGDDLVFSLILAAASNQGNPPSVPITTLRLFLAYPEYAIAKYSLFILYGFDQIDDKKFLFKEAIRRLKDALKPSHDKTSDSYAAEPFQEKGNRYTPKEQTEIKHIFQFVMFLLREVAIPCQYTLGLLTEQFYRIPTSIYSSLFNVIMTHHTIPDGVMDFYEETLTRAYTNNKTDLIDVRQKVRDASRRAIFSSSNNFFSDVEKITTKLLLLEKSYDAALQLREKTHANQANQMFLGSDPNGTYLK